MRSLLVAMAAVAQAFAFVLGFEVRVLEANVPAQLFWAGAIEMFTGAVIHPVRIEKDGEDWFVFAFESKRVP